MQLTNVLFSLLAVTSSVYAAPASIENVPATVRTVIARSPPTDLPKTIKGFPPKDWECKLTQRNDKTQTFSGKYIQESVEAGLRLRDNGDNKAGNSKYPGWLRSPESIDGLEEYKGQTNIDHFPLTHDGKTVFVGGRPTSDARVVYQHTVESDEATFIGVWTHAGRKDGKFEKCKEV